MYGVFAAPIQTLCFDSIVNQKETKNWRKKKSKHTEHATLNIHQHNVVRLKLDHNCITIYGNLIWLLLITIFTIDWIHVDFHIIFPAIVLSTFLYPIKSLLHNNNLMLRITKHVHMFQSHKMQSVASHVHNSQLKSTSMMGWRRRRRRVIWS